MHKRQRLGGKPVDDTLGVHAPPSKPHNFQGTVSEKFLWAGIVWALPQLCGGNCGRRRFLVFSGTALAANYSGTSRHYGEPPQGRNFTEFYAQNTLNDDVLRILNFRIRMASFAVGRDCLAVKLYKNKLS